MAALRASCGGGDDPIDVPRGTARLAFDGADAATGAAVADASVNCQSGGTVNSRFKMRIDGARPSFVSADCVDKVKAEDTRATVVLVAKGRQSDSCRNLIGPAGDSGEVNPPAGNPPADSCRAG